MLLSYWGRAVSLALLALWLALLDPGLASAQTPQSRFAEADGVKLHYLVAGKGDPVVLLRSGHRFASRKRDV